MKGALAEASRIFSQESSAHLFPTTTYHYNSGGEPDDIPTLTWEQLKAFHRTHYHPSNSYTATYGDLPMHERLRVIDETVMAHTERIDTAHTDVPDERRYTHPLTVTIKGPPPASAFAVRAYGHLTRGSGGHE